MIKVKQNVRKIFECSLKEDQLIEKIKNGKLFAYVQCEIEVPESLRADLANFLPSFTNTRVSQIDVGDLMKNFVAENLLTQPRKMLVSNFT